ncbi:MAG: 16S rRNA (guanine(966)-N(2))-methyltransferase RsmD [Proteobacteria bacterium]|nr:16S rRNA (guanine(966)-N(2))-methyltransferase RsmD [Pseudomonadota bacterium]MBU4295169.1 16S rRNA (guanine(966)-N(2))-methyltransferase RsmD [Pseudomonadota bacterium]MCG2749049.1 16S rRNA (guanine(966)-N(2))-methyltransferase RsmD [Desulfobulbaceae bacterium]
MRIIAGTARGRRLVSPGSGTFDIRPTSDRAREALFNILAREVAGARVLDLFAGTGALGLEALSRGAESTVFVDKGRSAVSLISKNIQLCGFWEKSVVLQRDLTGSLSFLQPYATACGFPLVFIDPPYKTLLAEPIILELGKGDIVSAGGLVVAESHSGSQLPAAISLFSLVDQRVYGEAGFWFYKKKVMEKERDSL